MLPSGWPGVGPGGGGGTLVAAGMFWLVETVLVAIGASPGLRGEASLFWVGCRWPTGVVITGGRWLPGLDWRSGAVGVRS